MDVGGTGPKAESGIIGEPEMSAPKIAPGIAPDLTVEQEEPGFASRAMDTATDVSRNIGEVAGSLKSAVDKLGDAVAESRKPGNTLGTISAITREAPLASLFVAFLLGVALTRRR